ncbi:hypothetical protein GFH30_05665 [Acinetobacter wanghuae]|uniref:Uncharacterized protein n=1 Tax=Acinetobacter wanghuae TaxID=2662362 RepID=A0A5Q0P2E4_9GAMM|nr:hypothetical protein [Acinetobacter wanghuae]MQW91551.1 hypothetical protein [Acinetobacter wanghuae]QGA10906.1 hypothetical protein GFH30_05665 [Acinetobacter wanghuae]
MAINAVQAGDRITMDSNPFNVFGANNGVAEQKSYWEKQREEERKREEDKKRYQSSTGTNYQYNLNNAVDRNNYSIDLDAQRRDQMSLNPTRSLDRGIGQFGGGIID